MSDPYKYYSKEQYEKYGDILETASQIDARLARAKNDERKNKILSDKYSQEWEERTYMTKLYKIYTRPEPDFI